MAIDDPLIILAELTVYDPSIPGTRTLRFTSGNRFVTGPADTPANTSYLPRLEQPGVLNINLLPALTGGVPAYGYGEIVLSNADGGLDYLKDYVFDGWTVSVKVHRLGDAYPSSRTFPEIIDATMRRPEFGRTIRIPIAARTRSSDGLVCNTVYAGTGTLEGAADLAGKAKPRVYGAPKNCPIPQVDSGLLIYQAADLTNSETGSAVAVTTVYDAGVVLTAGAAYPDQATLLSTAPAAGQYRVLATSAGTWIRLGSTPAGDVTADLSRSVSGAPWGQNLGDTVATIAADSVASGIAYTINAASAAVTATVGLFVMDLTTTFIQAAQMLAGGILGWVLRSGTAVWSINCLHNDIFSGASPGVGFEISDATLVGDIRLLANPGGPTNGVPAWQLVYEYGKNNHVQTTGLAGAVTQARREFLKQEFRTITKQDTSVKTAWPNAATVTVRSYLEDAAAADTEATRLFTLLKTHRVWVGATVRVNLGWEDQPTPWKRPPQAGSDIVWATVMKRGLNSESITNGQTLLYPLMTELDIKRSTVTGTFFGLEFN